MRTMSSSLAAAVFCAAVVAAAASATGESDADGVNKKSLSSIDEHSQFKHFIPHNESWTCSADEHATPFSNQIRGVNLGGLFVLEPWITPSLFFQFLGKPEGKVGMDTYTFCEVLGPEEGNRQLRRHWDTWITEEDIKKLADSGAVNSLRLPVGDYMYEPYGPYDGCFDGSLKYVERILDWAHEYGLTVLLDIHAMKGSQNGFDNSGKTLGFEWTSTLSVYPRNLVTFQHWPIRTAEWMGDFDRKAGNYSSINHDNIAHSIRVVTKIVRKYSGHPAVLGLEPVNEPWEKTPLVELKRFYWECYLIVKRYAPYWKFIMHDSFRFGVDFWGGFMAGCPDRAIDTHIYQAWLDPASRESFYNDACQQKARIAAMEAAFGPVIVGEWSLATDNCAMWLNGFNDNLPGFPRLPCKYVPCGESYMNEGDVYNQPGTPVDPSKPIQGPYGTGMSGPVWGLCPVGRDWVKESNPENGVDYIHAPAEALERRDDSDAVMKALALKKINAFSGIGHGFYFWNAKTDLDEAHWSYMAALEKGWIPSGNLNSELVMSACHKEDNGLYVCNAKRGQLESAVRKTIKAVDPIGDDASSVDSLEGDELFAKADEVFNNYWQAHRVEGATCDFGGLGVLSEVNATYDDTGVDDYFSSNINGIDHVILKLIVVLIIGGLIGGLIGFYIAMRASTNFNQKVVRKMENNKFLRNVSHSSAFQRSFGTNLNLQGLGNENMPLNRMKSSKSAAV